MMGNEDIWNTFAAYGVIDKQGLVRSGPQTPIHTPFSYTGLPQSFPYLPLVASIPEDATFHSRGAHRMRTWQDSRKKLAHMLLSFWTKKGVVNL